jgi:hypothetical protein
MKVWEVIEQLQRLNLPDADVYVYVNGGFAEDGDVTLEAKP